MQSRLWCAVLLLGAVFAMHGLSCAAAEGGVSAAPSAAVTASKVTVVHEVSVDHVMAAAMVGMGHIAGMDHTASSAPSEHSGGHGALAHALMVCLAVLGAGLGAALAALARWLARRRGAVVHRDPVVSLSAAIRRGRERLQAPELSRLCVLRV